MKGFKLFAFVVLALVLVSSGVFANHNQGSNFVTIDRVEVNDVQADENSPVFLERGEEAVVEVYFTGNPYSKCESGDDNPCYDARVEVELEGYEYGDVRDVEGPFEVEPGVAYRKVLRLNLPADMPSSDDLTLYVEVKDDDDLVLVEFPVRIQEARHSLNVFDVIFNPTNNVQAGQPLFTNVRVENLGDNVESSVKVTVAMPALGIQTSEFVDKLLTMENENDDDDDENADDAATTNDLLLMVPANTPEGDYAVVVTLEYNRGHSVESQTYTMHVRGGSATVVPQPDSVVVNVDSQAQRVNEGEGAVYKFTVGNVGMQASSFTFEVVGAESWSNVRVDPTTLVVQSDSTGDAFVYVAPKEGEEGVKTFTVRVKSGNNVVAEKNLSLEVVDDNNTAKTVFTWVFIVLLVILVVLVVVVLVKKYAKRDSGIEGQTYY